MTSAIYTVSAPALEHPPDEDADGERQDACADDDCGHIGCMIGIFCMANHAIAVAVGAQC